MRSPLTLLAGYAMLALSSACHPAAPPRAAPIPVAIPRADTARRVAVAAPSAPVPVRAETAKVAAPEVAREAVKIFGDSVAPAHALDSADAKNAVPRWDIDVHSYETQERVQHYVSRFSHEARGIFTLWLARGHRYEAMIRPKLRAAGLPEDMSYLPLIESGYDPNAYSRAAAVGLWQLMTSTAKDAGLRVDWWVDERRDPVRSTDAAVRFLKWLNKEFGSLYLAAAAYDGGPGRIARGLTRYADDVVGLTRDDAFFVLAEKDYLRAETREYVPQLIAAALIAKEPKRYGLDPVYLPALEYDSVRVGPATPLAAVAKASGSTMAEIRDLNPFLLRGLTPPKDSFLVRVPLGRGAMLTDSLSALPESDRKGLSLISVKKSETIGAVAARAGITVKQLGWYNRDIKSGKKGHLAAGTKVMVPSQAVVAAALDVPDPAIERYGSASRTRTVTHAVKRGETLAGIAKHYGTTVPALKKLNRFKGSNVVPGQVIVVKRSVVKRSTKARSKKGSAKKPSAKKR
ncbi:MAG: transglycosylase SLT domain-containing protein [Gemmatimonadota bacterium]|nr:transglycosylase SLT domain-containing protein [Gemmatimonadota bacterium]